jgi:hypothetical protein
MAAMRNAAEHDKAEMAFAGWLQLVDKAISKRIPGCSHHDLSDACYWDAWESGVSPTAMAKDVIAAEFGADL